MPSDAQVSAFLEEALKRTGLWGGAQATRFPLIARSGTLANGHAVHAELLARDEAFRLQVRAWARPVEQQCG
jgi:hypothetical protein